MAFAKFHSRHEDTAFYMHTNISDGGAGINLRNVVKGLGLVGCVYFPKQIDYYVGISTQELAEIYNSFDVFCLPGITPILVENGVKSIQHIKVGDKVLTHTGKFQKVVRTFKRPYSSSLIGVKCDYLQKEVQLTPEHPVMVRRGGWGTSKKTFLKASELQKGDYVFIPRPSSHRRVESIHNTDYPQSKSSRKLPRHIKFTPNLFSLMGSFVSEGCTSGDGLIFSFAPDHSDDELERDVYSAVKEISSDITVATYQLGHTRKVQVYNRKLGTMFASRFGHGAHHKHLPPEILHLCDERHKFISRLLRSLWLGDGYVAKDHFEYSTVSRQLAYQLFLLLLQHGILSSIKFQRLRKSWTLRVGGVSAEKFSSLTGLPLGTSGFRHDRRWKQNDYGAWIPIKNVRLIEARRTQYVYNLEVEEDNTYVPGFTVHNCLPRGGEGFGVPIVEAQSCGIPAILSNFTSGPELLGGGWLLKDLQKVWTYQDSWQVVPNVDEIVEYLEQAYQMKKDGSIVTLKKKARRKALEYDWDKVALMWDSILKDIESKPKGKNLEGVQPQRLMLIPNEIEPKKVLDIGCGVTMPYKPYLKELGKYVGVDIKGGDGIVKADACKLPFGDGEFGFVWQSEVLEHIATPQLAVNEAKRVGRHGVIMFPTPACPYFSLDDDHKEVKLSESFMVNREGNGLIIW